MKKSFLVTAVFLTFFGKSCLGLQFTINNQTSTSTFTNITWHFGQDIVDQFIDLAPMKTTIITVPKSPKKTSSLNRFDLAGDDSDARYQGGASISTDNIKSDNATYTIRKQSDRGVNCFGKAYCQTDLIIE